MKQYTSTCILAVVGRIARPTSAGTWYAGSTTINAARPEWTITSVEGNAVLGETLSKVGFKTGWTIGNVIETCVNGVNPNTPSGLQNNVICYDVVDAYAESGDSGAPVFKGLSGDNVRLYGILFAGNSNEGIYAMSGLYAIQRHFDHVQLSVHP